MIIEHIRAPGDNPAARQDIFIIRFSDDDWEKLFRVNSEPFDLRVFKDKKPSEQLLILAQVAEQLGQ